MKRPRAARADLAPEPAAGGAQFIIVCAVAALTVALHVLGATRFPGTLWGTHAYAFLPPAVLPAALAALAAAIGAGLWRLRGPAPAPPVPSAPARPRALAPALVRAGLALAAFAVFWGARSRQILLGDGIPLTANLPFEHTLHAREPLTSLVHQQAFRLAQASAAARDPHEVARDAVAFGSALAGVLFVFVAFALAGELLRLRGAPGEPPAPALRPLVAALLCTQGFVQLYFGYVENYAYEALAIAAYLWLALRYLRGAAPLLAPAALLLAAVAFNLAAVSLAPSFAVLVLTGLTTPGRRAGAARDLGAAAALAAALVLALNRADGAYRADREIAAMLAKGAGSFAYLISPEHFRDFLGEHLLIGPFALMWFLPVALHVLLMRTRPRPALAFLGVAGLAQAVTLWTVADLPLGYARDWDLFAPFAAVFVAAAIGLVLSQAPGRRAIQRMAVVAVSVSVFHTAPWIAINASADRSLERFKRLPLGQGRTESTVGFWYFSQGRLDEARDWLERALAEDPTNVRAYAHLGSMELAAGRYAAAERYLAEAVRRRPNQPLFRETLVRALLAQDRAADALEQLAVLIELEPARPRHWAMAGVLLAGFGRTIEAHEALLRAARLAPGDSLYAAALARMDQPEAYAALLAHEWPRIVER